MVSVAAGPRVIGAWVGLCLFGLAATAVLESDGSAGAARPDDRASAPPVDCREVADNVAKGLAESERERKAERERLAEQEHKAEWEGLPTPGPTPVPLSSAGPTFRLSAVVVPTECAGVLKERGLVE
ncbi:hypothetical protein [Streptomyces sp. VRA16 Mangrove soil]|uniref:hypothetical protein n=1 Tax=Streptomyces sp. VRA16 Mangrove soil TaxID=2817434 RepID=UPI001A9FF31D|nr:hypothetical protein [Streptomyces sp. VRA16 Mangrove soil]MBO1334792.1 hypothetical protein [Streptomyces sp. VRA16 Mangrove soil]